MDYNDPSRRQYAQNPYATQQLPQGTAQSSSQYANPGTAERFRQAPYLQPSTANAPSTARAGSDAQLYGYAQSSQYGSGGPVPAQAVQYTPDLQTPEIPLQQQDTAQQYGYETMGGVYGLGSQTQQAAQATYDPASRYAQPRPSAASGTLASQFGAQQAPQYYIPGPTLPTSATIPDLAATRIPAQYQQSAYASAGPSSTYTTTMMDPTQPSTYPATYAAPYAADSSSSQVSVDQRFGHYKSQIRTIFSYVREGRIRDIGDTLLQVSTYLLGNAETLGLTRDDDNVHDDHILLWDEFNRVWLTTLQAQYDLVDEWFRNQHAAREPRSVMDQQMLESLCRELVRLCDSVEKHGLVDYQMGIAEEEIMDLLLRCLSQLELESSPTAEAAAGPAV